MSMIAMKIPQIMKYKLYLISMMINSNSEVRQMVDQIFDHSCGHDFGSREKKGKDGTAYTITNEMWGNDIVTRGKRVDQRFEQYIGDREEFADDTVLEGTQIDKDNPSVPYSYLRKLWDMPFPILGHTYMIHPDPVTNFKLIDVDTEEMIAHSEAVGKKLKSEIDMIKLTNTANRLLPRMFVKKFADDMTANLLLMSDAIKSNLSLPKDTKFTFSGNGMHFYAKFDQRKVDEWADKEHKFARPLVCSSNKERGFVRMVGSTNMKVHMQMSFPLFGWDSTEEAFAMANPCFFALQPSKTIERTYQKFDKSGVRTSTAKLSDVIENYRKCCVPSSSKNEDYMRYRLKNEDPELFQKTEQEATAVFGANLDRRYRWETIRMAQEQFTLDYSTIKEMIR